MRERLRVAVRYESTTWMGGSSLVAYTTVTGLVDSKGRIRRKEFRYQLVRLTGELDSREIIRVDNCEGQPHLHRGNQTLSLGPIDADEAYRLFQAHVQSMLAGGIG